MLLTHGALMVQLVLALALSIGNTAHADDVHFAAHVGTAFALQTGFYGVNEKWIGLSKRDAELLAFAEMMAVGFLYKRNEGLPRGTWTSVGENAVGGVLAIGVHVTFGF